MTLRVGAMERVTAVSVRHRTSLEHSTMKGTHRLNTDGSIWNSILVLNLHRNHGHGQWECAPFETSNLLLLYHLDISLLSPPPFIPPSFTLSIESGYLHARSDLPSYFPLANQWHAQTPKAAIKEHGVLSILMRLGRALWSMTRDPETQRETRPGSSQSPWQPEPALWDPHYKLHPFITYSYRPASLLLPPSRTRCLLVLIIFAETVGEPNFLKSWWRDQFHIPLIHQIPRGFCVTAWHYRCTIPSYSYKGWQRQCILNVWPVFTTVFFTPRIVSQCHLLFTKRITTVFWHVKKTSTYLHIYVQYGQGKSEPNLKKRLYLRFTLTPWLHMDGIVSHSYNGWY